MKQYYSVKAVHPDTLLLFRVGDFYETYGDDAEPIVGTERKREGYYSLPCQKIFFFEVVTTKFLR